MGISLDWEEDVDPLTPRRDDLNRVFKKGTCHYSLSTEITQVARRCVRCRPMSMQSLRRGELC
jgi:hypothetical protein